MNDYAGCHIVSNAQQNSHCSEILPENADGLFNSVATVHCLCGCDFLTESMVQCEEPKCHLLQHSSCVLIPREQAGDIPGAPPQFYCQICRINQADPFLLTVAEPLCPVKFMGSCGNEEGENLVNNVAAFRFYMSEAQTNLLKNSEYDIQVWCILLNDSVPFRMQWPLHATLCLNGYAIQTYDRPSTQKLGANGRDEGLLVKAYINQGANLVSLAGCDSRTFSFGVRVVQSRNVQQVLDLITKQKDGERFEDAVARVKRCIGSKSVCESADDDLEVLTQSITVNTRCPISGSRIRIAGRFKPCTHMGCFDLETFVNLCQRTNKLQYCEDDVTNVEIRPDGCWRVTNAKSTRDLSEWHYPDGTICLSNFKNGSKLDNDYSDLKTVSVVRSPEKLSSSSQKFVLSRSYLAMNDVDRVCQSSRDEDDGLPFLPSAMDFRHGSTTGFGAESRRTDSPRTTSGYAQTIYLTDSDDENGKLNSSGAVDQVGREGCAPEDISFIGMLNSRLSEASFLATKNRPRYYDYSKDKIEMSHHALASARSEGSGILLTGSRTFNSAAQVQGNSSMSYPQMQNGNFYAPFPTALSPTQTSDPLQFSVGKDVSVNDYEVDYHSGLESQFGRYNRDLNNQGCSMSVGSNPSDGGTGYISALNPADLRNQLEVAMSFPFTAGYSWSLNDYISDMNPSSLGIDNNLYLSPERDAAPAHSSGTQQTLGPRTRFVPAAEKGDT